MTGASLHVSVYPQIREIPADQWDACACPEAGSGHPSDPFTTHRFLLALEESGSVYQDSGWSPIHLGVSDASGLVAVMPLYVKYHSQGEFVFDHGWAHAFECAGGAYYPKLQSSVPFTPVSGRRFLTKPGHDTEGRKALAATASRILADHNLSSLHVTFCPEEEAEFGESCGFLRRAGTQFHWFNRGYADFEAFLAVLSSRKRKNIRQERQRASGFGGEIHRLTGPEILAEHWDAFWNFYQDTGSRKWGIPYLTRQFFEIIHETMRDDILLIMCKREGNWIAGALNFIGRDALFGRYWGCIEQHSCLHFEVCYYQAIEFAIARQLSRVEAGAQGPHKLARGYMPIRVHSVHWIANRPFRQAVLDYLDQELAEVGMEIEHLQATGPFRKTG